MLLDLNCHLTALIGPGDRRGPCVGGGGERALCSWRDGCYLSVCVSSCEMLSGSCCPVLHRRSSCLCPQWPNSLHLLFGLPACKWRKPLLASATDIYLFLSSQLCIVFSTSGNIFVSEPSLHHWFPFIFSLLTVRTVKLPNPDVLLHPGW